MPDPSLSLMSGLVAATAATPPPELPGWMLPLAAVTALVSWWLHRRWRAGRHFMSRFTTRERESAKFARAGFGFLPAAIAATAITMMLALWSLFGLVANAWFGYAFLSLATTSLVAAAWVVKEYWWPTKRRAPEWTRRL